MNIMNRVTLQYLLKNRRRTIVTILGVIISAAMIAAVSTFADSFLDLMQRDEIYQDGEWHIQYMNVARENVERIGGSEAVALAGLSREEGYFKPQVLPELGYEYLYVQSYDPTNFQLRNIRMVEGRLPEFPGELILTEENAWGLKPGDTLTGVLGDRILTETGEIIRQNYLAGPETFSPRETRAYQIVGIFQENWPSSYRSGDKALTLLEQDSQPVNVTVRLQKVGPDVFQDPWDLNQYGETVNYHQALLRYMGIVGNREIMGALYQAAGIVLMIILAGSVLLIYNAFAISIAERSRQLGMLSSVGATRKQKRNSVFFEGFLIGVTAIPLGLLFGILGIGITFTLVSPLIQNALRVAVPFQVKVSLPALLGAVIFSALTIFISVLRPAVQASRITPIEAIRQTKEIALTGRKVRTSRLIRRLFDMEGELAMKNLKRQRKRYRATIISLAVSVVLFLTAASFNYYLDQAYRLANNDIQYDVQMLISGQGPQDLERMQSLAARAASLPEVTEAVITPSWYLYGCADVEQSLVAPETARLGQMEAVPGKSRFNVSLTTMDEQSLSRFCADAGIAPALLEGEGNPAILIDPIHYQSDGVYYELNQLKLDGPLDMECTLSDGKPELTGSRVSLRIAAQTPLVPAYQSALRTSKEELILILHPDRYGAILRQLRQELASQPGYTLPDSDGIYVLASSTDPEKTEETMDQLLAASSGLGGGAYDLTAARRQMEQLSILVAVFLYGFVVLIALISVANIFNTISTSVALRRREFAVLQSVGMTSREFHRMLRFESLFYGLKALLYGLPLSFGMMFLVHRSLDGGIVFGFSLPWASIGAAVGGVFLIVGLTMLYSSRKAGRDSIVAALTDENL